MIKISKSIISMLILGTTLFNMFPTLDVKATEMSTSLATEKELIEIIENYGDENIIFENAKAINKGQSIQVQDIIEELSEEAVLISNNEEIMAVENTSIVGLSEGTTFLIVYQNGVYHVMEVYVADSTLQVATYDTETRIKGHYLVYVDAGHGGSDPGASGNGIKEKDLNLTIALKIRNKLNAQGVEVIMNRDTDIYVNYKDTAAHANSVNPDVFVSVHNNSSTSSSVNGIESYYSKDIDIPYGQLIQRNLINNTKANDRGFKQDIYYVTNNTKMPAVLIEGGFISNSDEAEKLKQDYYQEAIANAVVDGVMEYLRANVKPDVIPAQRISGESRYETAIEIFNNGWQTAETVILVTGENYPDALCATPLAAKHDAPILLSRNTSLKNQSALYNTLKTKGVKNVIIIGSEGIIPKSVEADLHEVGINTRRIAGSDRYETSVAIAKEVGINSGEVIVAYGDNFPDGLSIASIAAKKQIPILLTWNSQLPGVINNYIKSQNINKTYLLGSEGLISNNVANNLTNVERLAGSDRYETNEKIFNRFKDELNLSLVYIASALNFPDALATSALAAKTNSFVVLSHPTYVMQPVRSIIENSKSTLEKVYVIGSKGLIPDNTFTGIGIGLIK